MKIIRYLLVLMIVSFSQVYSQQPFTFTPETTYLHDTLGIEAEFVCWVKNTSSASIDVIFIRTINDLPPDWTSSICLGQCYPPTTDSVQTDVPLAPGDSIEFDMHVFTMTANGTAYIQVKAYEKRSTEEPLYVNLIYTTFPSPSFTFSPDATTKIGEIGGEIIFDVNIQNITQDTLSLYTVKKIQTLPADWTCSLCFGENCYPPDIDSILNDIPLAPGDTCDFSLHVYPLNTAGTGYIRILAGRVDNPADTIVVDFTADVLTSIKENNASVRDFSLSQNYPNPFNPSTDIEFTLPLSGNAALIIYNSLGEKTEELFNGYMPAGKYRFNFNSGNLPSGVYFYKLTSGNYSETRKMILEK